MVPDGPDDLVALGHDREGGRIAQGRPEAVALLALRDGLPEPFLNVDELLEEPGAAPAALAELVELPAGGRPVPQHRPGQETANPSRDLCGLVGFSSRC
jgi:hypothetical protein